MRRNADEAERRQSDDWPAVPRRGAGQAAALLRPLQRAAVLRHVALAQQRDAGNFNLVSRSAVDRLHRRLRGRRGLTARLVYSRSKNRRAVPSALTALHMLYVLVATDRAIIDPRRKAAREIFFNVKR